MKKISLLIVLLFQLSFVFAQERDNVGHRVGPWNFGTPQHGITWKIRRSYYSDNSEKFTNEIEIKNTNNSTVTFSYNISENANETGTRYRKTLAPNGTYTSTYCPNAQSVNFFVELSNGQVTNKQTPPQNDLTEYNRSKAEMERKLDEKNAQLQQDFDNAYQSYKQAFEAGLRAYNNNNYTEAQRQFQLAMNASTTEEQRRGAKENYDKAVNAPKRQATGELVKVGINAIDQIFRRDTKEEREEKNRISEEQDRIKQEMRVKKEAERQIVFTKLSENEIDNPTLFNAYSDFLGKYLEIENYKFDSIEFYVHHKSLRDQVKSVMFVYDKFNMNVYFSYNRDPEKYIGNKLFRKDMLHLVSFRFMNKSDLRIFKKSKLFENLKSFTDINNDKGVFTQIDEERMEITFNPYFHDDKEFLELYIGKGQLPLKLSSSIINYENNAINKINNYQKATDDEIANIARIYSQGYGVLQDIEKTNEMLVFGLKKFPKSEKLHFIYSQHLLLDKGDKTGLLNLKQSAVLGNPNALTVLSEIYRKGSFFCSVCEEKEIAIGSKDFEKANRLLLQAAEYNDGLSFYYLSEYYKNGTDGFGKNEKLAQEYLKKFNQTQAGMLKSINSKGVDLSFLELDDNNNNEQKSSNESKEKNYEKKDNDPKYGEMKIGNIIWLNENSYEKPLSGEYDNLNNENANPKKIMMFYNWEAAKTACPKGYRLPKIEEMANLFERYGMISRFRLPDDIEKNFKRKTGEASETYENALADHNMNFPATQADHEKGFQTLFWTSNKSEDKDRAYAFFINHQYKVINFSNYPVDMKGLCRCVKE